MKWDAAPGLNWHELARIHATDRFFFWSINLVFVHLICRVLSVVCMWLHGSCSSYGTMNCDIYIYNYIYIWSCVYIYMYIYSSRDIHFS